MVLKLKFKPLPNLFCFSSFKYISNLPLVWSVILLLYLFCNGPEEFETIQMGGIPNGISKVVQLPTLFHLNFGEVISSPLLKVLEWHEVCITFKWGFKSFQMETLLGTSFYSLSLNFHKVSNYTQFHPIIHTTIKQTIKTIYLI